MKLLTIRALCSELKAEGGGHYVPEHVLRSMVKSGVVRSFRSGNRVYLTREWLEEYLSGNGAPANPAPQVERGTIRSVK